VGLLAHLFEKAEVLLVLVTAAVETAGIVVVWVGVAAAAAAVDVDAQ